LERRYLRQGFADACGSLLEPLALGLIVHRRGIDALLGELSASRENPTPAGFLERRRVAEVSADGRLHFLPLSNQPEHQEERHHRRDEISVGDFPGATMMAAAVISLLADDDDWGQRAHA